eukprot:CAMPEP_0198730482 /NCGR_PEP_ID=MMETSP1475-20131203/24709_1 /TAXON_ID= ORGANISM="Unidentified sp., Strain CCMP1999" /NCGR_SAMPLE_ID=MMETSP1475 /ASSEMBLY_ACC=CAM_ASM_001111 /LENGTH=285 /DNA_ID=CAMNT_0044493293 /DNA_START=68 /DNA_END=921 /DNA_ORIENTATION=-
MPAWHTLGSSTAARSSWSSHGVPGVGASLDMDDKWEHGHWVFEEHDLRVNTPSQRDGFSAEDEQKTIQKHVQLIEQCAADLKMQGTPTYVAILLFRRFFLVASLKDVDKQAIAEACLFLAGKICEYLRKCKDIIYWCIKTYTKGSEDFPDGEEIKEDNARYLEEKLRLLSAERELLRVLNFDFNVEIPHDHIKRMVLTIFGSGTTGKHVRQAALNFLVDSFASDVHLLYSSTEVAAACILVGAAYANINLEERSGYSAFGATKQRSLMESFKLDPKRVAAAADTV